MSYFSFNLLRSFHANDAELNTLFTYFKCFLNLTISLKHINLIFWKFKRNKLVHFIFSIQDKLYHPRFFVFKSDVFILYNLYIIFYINKNKLCVFTNIIPKICVFVKQVYPILIEIHIIQKMDTKFCIRVFCFSGLFLATF